MALPNEIHPFAIAGGGNQYQVANSLRFRASNSAYLSRTVSGTGNEATYTWSGWVKRGSLGSQQVLFSAYALSNYETYFRFTSSDTLQFYNLWAETQSIITSQVFRDPSAWYHIVLAVNLTGSPNTYSNCIKMYVNGVQITSFGTTTFTNVNTSSAINGPYAHAIGQAAAQNTNYFDGYIAEVNFIEGSQLDPSYFGQTDSITNQWVPKKYTGNYGTRGFYLPFNDATSTTTLGYDRQLGMTDSSKNNWTASGISVTSGVTYDWMIDSPTNYNDGGNNRGNYAVLNPLSKSTYNPTISDGNLKAVSGGTAGGYISCATFGVTSGKWYFEATCILNEGTYIYPVVGIGDISNPGGAPGNGTYEAGYFADGRSYYNGSFAAFGATWTTNDIIGVAFDLNSSQRTIQFFKNGSSQGTINITTDTTINLTPKVGMQGTNEAMAVNFGQRPFTYTPPAGYLALNTYNLADPSLPLV